MRLTVHSFHQLGYLIWCFFTGPSDAFIFAMFSATLVAALDVILEGALVLSLSSLLPSYITLDLRSNIAILLLISRVMLRSITNVLLLLVVILIEVLLFCP